MSDRNLISGTSVAFEDGYAPLAAHLRAEAAKNGRTFREELEQRETKPLALLFVGYLQGLTGGLEGEELEAHALRVAAEEWKTAEPALDDFAAWVWRGAFTEWAGAHHED